MTFAHPDLLIWLWLLPAAAAMLWLVYRRRRGRLAAFCGAGPTVAGLRRGRVAIKAGLGLTALAAAIVALAQPRWGFEWTDVKRRGIDVVVAIDVSNSMLASDVEPTRLERAKRKLSDLLTMMQGDLVGLVAFAGEAFVQCPLTEDYGAVRLFSNYLDAGLIPVQGTDLGKAIGEAMRALKDGGRNGSTESSNPAAGEGEAEESGATQAIILITDGEDNEGKGLEQAAKAKAAGIRIYTIAIGSAEGAPIPESGGGFKKDAQGNLVLTKPDETSLQKIAIETGGLFVRSVASDADLQQVYEQGIRRKLTERDVRETRQKLWYERYQWFVALAMGLLTIEWLLRDVRLAVWFLAALGGLGAASARAGSERQAHEDFAKGEFGKAAAEFLEAEVDAAGAPDKAYNRAVAQYRAKDFANAAGGFAAVAEHAGATPELAQRSRFNEGNAWVGAGKLDEAISAYEAALALKDDDSAAKENLEYVKKLKEQQQQQQDKQSKQQGAQDQQGQQDQQQRTEDDSQQQSPPQGAPEKSPDATSASQPQSSSPSPEQTEKQEPQSSASEAAPQKDNHNQDQTQQGLQNSPAVDPSQQAKTVRNQQSRGNPMAKDEAEQVLRSVDDKIGQFLYAPQNPQDRAPSRQKPGKDW